MPFQHLSRIRGGRMSLIKGRIYKIAEHEAKHHNPLSEKGKKAGADLKELHYMNRKDMTHSMERFLEIEARYPSILTVSDQS